MTKTKLFFDLDGTLIDSTKRLYLLFQYLIPESYLSYEDYWKLKREMQTHSSILENRFSYLDEKIRAFEENWMTSIEKENWLKHDEPFPGVQQYLQSLSTNHTLYLITARQSTSAVVKQIDSFGWHSLFKEILVTNQTEEKSDIILSVTSPSSIDWIVGDTGKDIEAGKKLGMKTAAVLSGFRNRSVLEKYNPDIIRNIVTDIFF